MSPNACGQINLVCFTILSPSFRSWKKSRLNAKRKAAHKYLPSPYPIKAKLRSLVLLNQLSVYTASQAEHI